MADQRLTDLSWYDASWGTTLQPIEGEDYDTLYAALPENQGADLVLVYTTRDGDHDVEYIIDQEDLEFSRERLVQEGCTLNGYYAEVYLDDDPEDQGEEASNEADA